MTKTVDFIFDFGSPNAYLTWQVLPAIAQRHGATITATGAVGAGCTVRVQWPGTSDLAPR